MTTATIEAPSRLSWEQINQTADMLAVVAKHVPETRGHWNGYMTNEVPCPKCGGKTRFRLRLGHNGLMMAFCSHCAEAGLTPIRYIAWYYDFDLKTAADWWRDQHQVTVKVAVPPKQQEHKPLELAIALRCHNRMDVRARDYMHARGMNDHMIDHFKVGYHTGFKRYSFPLIIGGMLWGIQYRLNPKLEYVLKFLRLFEHPEHRVDIKRYVSETGSHNHNLYARDEIQDGDVPLPYAVLIEGVPDVVAMWSQGFPAFSTFQGNNRAKPWDVAWNKYLAEIETIYVIPDNDVGGNGDFFASEKAKAIGPRAHIHLLPKGYKDIGEFIMADLTTAPQRLADMLHLPPLKELLQ